MEYKTIAISELKFVDERTVAGIAAVTGNVDSYGDRLRKGAFKKTIRERKGKVRHLWQHDFWSPPIAAIRELREVGVDELPPKVLKKAPDATGGLEVTRSYLETPRGNEVLAGLKSGAINEMSFAFDPVKFDFEEEGEEGARAMIRNVREVRLYDTSDVNWGANPATAGVKGLASSMPQFAGFMELVTTVYLLEQPEQFDVAVGRLVGNGFVDDVRVALQTLQKALTAEPVAETHSQALTDAVLARLAVAERTLVLVDL